MHLGKLIFWPTLIPTTEVFSLAERALTPIEKSRFNSRSIIIGDKIRVCRAEIVDTWHEFRNPQQVSFMKLEWCIQSFSDLIREFGR